MTIKTLFLASLLLSSTAYAQNSIAVDINNKDVEILGSINLNTLNSYADGTTYILDLSYLHTEDASLSTIGISGQNTLQGVAGLTLAFGAKAILAEDYFSLPLVAKVNYKLPLNGTIPSTSLIANFAYAPSVLSFSDAESYRELRVEADMEVIPNIHLFTGYRNLHTEYKDNDLLFNNSFYGGMKLSF